MVGRGAGSPLPCLCSRIGRSGLCFAFVVAGAADMGFDATPVAVGAVIFGAGGDPHAAGDRKLVFTAPAADIDAVAAGLAVEDRTGDIVY